eukprot:2059198-Lingulodinium_polyedra.AAC.1
MYRPRNEPCLREGENCPALEELGGTRLTVCVYRSGDSEVFKDQWRSSSPQRLPMRGWVGTTTFIRLPDASTTVDSPVTAKGLKGLK